MTEFLDDEENDLYEEEKESTGDESGVLPAYQPSTAEARRRLDRLLAEKKLRDDLEDFFESAVLI